MPYITRWKTVLLAACACFFSAAKITAQTVQLTHNWTEGQTLTAPYNVGVTASGGMFFQVANMGTATRSFTLNYQWTVRNSANQVLNFVVGSYSVSAPTGGMTSEFLSAGAIRITSSGPLTGSVELKVQLLEDGQQYNDSNRPYSKSAATAFAMETMAQIEDETAR